MFYRRNWIVVIVVILSQAMFIPVAQAERQNVEFILCGKKRGSNLYSG
jgi:hypothetical protein